MPSVHRRLSPEARSTFCSCSISLQPIHFLAGHTDTQKGMPIGTVYRCCQPRSSAADSPRIIGSVGMLAGVFQEGQCFSQNCGTAQEACTPCGPPAGCHVATPVLWGANTDVSTSTGAAAEVVGAIFGSCLLGLLGSCTCRCSLGCW